MESGGPGVSRCKKLAIQLESGVSDLEASMPFCTVFLNRGRHRERDAVRRLRAPVLRSAGRGRGSGRGISGLGQALPGTLLGR